MSTNVHSWLTTFNGNESPLSMPWNLEGETIRITREKMLSMQVAENISAVCKGNSATNLAYCTTVFSLVLGRYCNADKGMLQIGYENQSFPLLWELNSESSLREYFMDSKEKITDALAKGGANWGSLISKYEAQFSKDGKPILEQVAFVYGELPKIDQEKVSFIVQVVPQGKSFNCVLHAYIEEGFASVCEDFMDSFIQMLAKVKQEINLPLGQTSLLSSKMKKVVEDFGNGHGVHDDIHASSESHFMLEWDENVTRFPFKRAIMDGKQQISYLVLDRRANAIAATVTKRQNQRIEVVAALLESGIDFVATALASFKIGASFLPIDPAYPKNRIAYLLSNSGATILIGSEYKKMEEVDGLPTFISVNEIPKQLKEYTPQTINKTTLAYLIYTSGTTGKPNGVSVDHGALYNLCTWHCRYYGVKTSDIASKYAGVGFDATIWEIFPTLMAGACLQIIDKNARKDIEALHRTMLQKGTTIAFLPTQVAEVWMRKESTELRTLLVGADKLKTIAENNTYKIYNNYGPTENAVVTTAAEITQNEKNIPIGYPIDGVEVMVLSADMETKQPVGVEGEICLSGKSLARGYWKNPVLTDEKFVVHPFDATKRMYKTGDLGRWRPDGQLSFLGRKDNQVKINGHRVELAEVEKMIVQFPTIEDAVALIPTEQHNKILVFATAKSSVKEKEVLSYLRAGLPQHMVPAQVFTLDAIPLTPNGKVDKKALVTIFEKNTNKELPKGRLPESDLELMVAEIWCAVLNINSIGLEDDFFALGGDSIKAMQIESRVHNKGWESKQTGLFASPVFGSFMQTLSPTENVLPQAAQIGAIELHPVQKAFLHDLNISNRQWYNQSLILEFDRKVSVHILQECFSRILVHHDMLRASMDWSAPEVLHIAEPNNEPVKVTVLTAEGSNTERSALENAMLKEASFGSNAPLYKIFVLQKETSTFIGILIHHLIVDVVSWRIILDDLETLVKGEENSAHTVLPLKTAAYGSFNTALAQWSQSTNATLQLAYWEAQLVEEQFKSTETQEKQKANISLDLSVSKAIMGQANQFLHTQPQHLLVAALNQTVFAYQEFETYSLWMEGHGRKALPVHLDLNRTVGWCTTIYPIAMHQQDDLTAAVEHAKEKMENVPNFGIGYAALRFGNYAKTLAQENKLVSFNYLGDFDTDAAQKSFIVHPTNAAINADFSNGGVAALEVSAVHKNGRLNIEFSLPLAVKGAPNLTSFAKDFKAQCSRISAFCLLQKQSFLTPSDVGYSTISPSFLRNLQLKMQMSDLYALSPVQQGMFFHEQQKQQENAYNEQVQYQIKGNFEPAFLHKALESVVQHYDVLKTRFLKDEEGNPLQVVGISGNVSFQFYDLRSTSSETVQQKVFNYKQEAIKTYSLEAGELFSLAVFQSEKEAYFVWSFHHILMDGWCALILSADFHRCYTSALHQKPVELKPVRPYKEYISWLQRQDKEEARLFWNRYLSGFTAHTPIVQERNATADYLPKDLVFSYSIKQTTALHNFAKQHKVTLSNVFLSIWGIILARLNLTQDVVFGRVVSGRPANFEGIENMVGLFINTLPFRCTLKTEDQFIDLVKRVQEELQPTDTFSYHSLSDMQKETKTNPLFDHIFAYENYPAQSGTTALPKWEQMQYRETTNYPFNVVVLPGESIRVNFKYNANAFAPYFVAQLQASFLTLTNQVLEQRDIPVHQLELVEDKTKAVLLEQFNTVPTQNATNLFLEEFSIQCRANADRRALVYGNQQMSYGYLNEISDSIAVNCIQKGIKKGEVIGVMMEKDQWMVPVLLGILKSGAVFMPIDPLYPETRVNHMLEDSKAQWCIVNGTIRTNFPIHCRTIESLIPDCAPLSREDKSTLDNIEISSKDPAYIIYTSGTTGTPNGVVVPHIGLANLCFWHRSYYGLTAQDISSKFAGFGFDASVWEIFPSLYSGASLCITQEKNKYNLPSLNLEFEKQGVTVAFLPTPLGEQFMEMSNQTLRALLLGGDKLRRFNGQNDYRVYNNYGPSENAVVTTAGEITSGQKNITIGKPIANSHVVVLNKERTALQPIGAIGELCIASEGLALSYLGKPELTKTKFIPHPIFSNTTLYCTGDLVRWQEDGTLLFEGRTDHQVKIRGHRIELGEVERELQNQKGVLQACVLVKPNANGHASLLAFYTSEQTIEPSFLKTSLHKVLPYFMVPSELIPIERIPINTNGKVEEKGLLELAELQRKKTNWVQPINATQQKVLEIWKEVLAIDQIGVEDNFFDLGGTSLDTMPLSNALGIAFELEPEALTMAIFTYPTVQLLSDYIEGMKEEAIPLEIPSQEKNIESIQSKRRNQRRKRRAI